MSEQNQTPTDKPQDSVTTGAAISAQNPPEKTLPEKNAAPDKKVQAAADTGSPKTDKSQAKVQASVQTANGVVVPPVVVKQSGGKAVGALALVLALVALGASGFLFVEGQNVLKNQELAFNQKIDKAAVGESDNAAVLRETLRKQNEVAAVLAALQQSQQQNQEQIANANRAYRELLKSRPDWLVNETEATLSLASQQLLLSGNIPMVIAVLEGIENRLGHFDQPELLPIKQAISNDLAQLKNRPYLDVTAAALRLDRLETSVAGLPLLVDNTLKPGKVGNAPAENPNASWWQNAWNKMRFSLQGLVEVRHLDNNDAMLIAPEQAYFVRENLRLRMMDAHLALMQRNSEVYQNDLANAEAAVRQYFDGSSPATQSWLKELADLKTLQVGSVSEDMLKASLAAIRDYRENMRTDPTIVLPADNAASAASETARAASQPSAASAPQPASAAKFAAAVKGDRT